jgi:hypothetical protein
MCYNTNYAKRCHHSSSFKMELLVSQYVRIHPMAPSIIAKLLWGALHYLSNNYTTRNKLQQF